MKRFNVTYHVTTEYDAEVTAKNATEAKEKVREVIGEPVTILATYELREKTDA